MMYSHFATGKNKHARSINGGGELVVFLSENKEFFFREITPGIPYSRWRFFAPFRVAVAPPGP